MASRLTEAHITGQERLRAGVVRAVERVWLGLGSYDEADVERFLSVVVPLILAGQRASVSLTEAYVARALNRRPVGVEPGRLIGAPLRGGVSPQEVYRRPFVKVWTLLKAGSLYPDAVSAGGSQASASAAMDVQLSSRATFGALAAADDDIRGYRRVADANACQFCRSVSGAFVKSASAMALHNRCGCSLEPVVDDFAPTPVPDSVAVHEHGELGAVLTDPAHNFQTL